jgi:adenine-specific DNA-methyltransferase
LAFSLITLLDQETGHAIIELNREDDGKRKYILVEMGDYFEQCAQTSYQQVVYSKD